MIEMADMSLMEKLLVLPELIINNYKYVLGLVAVIAYIMVEAEAKYKDNPVSGFAKFMLFIKQFPMVLLVIVGFLTVASLYIIVVLTLFGYARDLLESAGLSFLEYPVVIIIVFCVITGTILVYAGVIKFLDRRRLLRTGFLTKKDLTKDEIKQFYGDEDEEIGQHNEKE